jgi:nitrite reductase/ring-hydroxylating ferredoxin subunit
MLYRVCSPNEIRDSCMRVYTIKGKDILIGRRSGTLFAFDNSCPHRGASLSKGEFDGTNIVCYMHGYEYDIFTGKLVRMKSWKRESTWIEQSPEWRRAGNLKLYKISEEGGNVFVDLKD